MQLEFPQLSERPQISESLRELSVTGEVGQFSRHFNMLKLGFRLLHVG